MYTLLFKTRSDADQPHMCSEIKSKSQASFSLQLLDVECHSTLTAPQGKKRKKVEERKPIKFNFCAPVLCV